MEAATIDQLFPAVLEEIFSHLSASDVKNCALVCKNWDEVIGSSEITMKKFELFFYGNGDDESDEEQNELQQHHSTRKHRNLRLEFTDQPTNQPPFIFEHFDLSQAKQLRLYAEFTETIKTIIVPTLLSRMPLLEDLYVSFYHNKFEDTCFPIVTLEKLRKLRVKEGSTADSFLKFIVTPNITDLRYTEKYAAPGSEHSDASIDLMADFIKDKKKLANLSMSTIMFQKLIGRHDFSELLLESLNVRGRGLESLEYSDTAQANLKKLLLSNADSLTSLQIPALFIPKEIFMAIFSGLRKLATLDIDGDVNVSGSWIENFSPNRTLKSLVLTQSVTNDGLKKILQLTPHIAMLSLYLTTATDSLLNRIIGANRRVVKLEINLMESIRGGLRFNELKSLKLQRFQKVDFLASLLESCPEAETFEFYGFNEGEMNSIVETLRQQNTLKHLRMPLWSQKLCRSIFDQLKVNYGNLRSATFYMRDDEFIQFDFPENPAEWNVEEQETRFSSYLATLRH